MEEAGGTWVSEGGGGGGTEQQADDYKQKNTAIARYQYTLPTQVGGKRKVREWDEAI